MAGDTPVAGMTSPSLEPALRSVAAAEADLVCRCVTLRGRSFAIAAIGKVGGWRGSCGETI